MERKQSQLLLMTHDSMHNQLFRGINHLSFAMFNHLQVLPALLLPVFLLACSSSAPCPRFLGEKSICLQPPNLCSARTARIMLKSQVCSLHWIPVSLFHSQAFLKSKTEFLALF